MSNGLLIPESKNLSLLWAEVFLALMERGAGEIGPLIISVTDIDRSGVVNEVSPIRQRLDDELLADGEQSCHTVANTIFPESLWNPHASDNGEHLYQRYQGIWPAVKKHPHNRRGVYFQRLVRYLPKGTSGEPVNQLKHVIETYKAGNHRRSALQAALFDPTRDHTDSKQQGFPCLQQVAFIPLGEDGLCITGFYPIQYVFERAYGNYLGLCRLGRFMAAQMGLSLVRMTCVSVVAQRGNQSKYSKIKLQRFADDLRQILSTIQPKV